MENVKLLLSRNSQFRLEEKIKNKNKIRTRASLFQFAEEERQEYFLCGLNISIFNLKKSLASMKIIGKFLGNFLIFIMSQLHR